MRSLILNIGMNESSHLGTGKPYGVALILDALRENGWIAYLSSLGMFFDRKPVPLFDVHQGEDEATCVVVLALPTIDIIEIQTKVDVMARALKQDCIAVVWDRASSTYFRGVLIGPRAADWGSFDAQYCIDSAGVPFSNRKFAP